MKTGVSYFGNRIARHYRERDLPEIVDAGCTFVVHTFSENDLRFYPGAMAELVAATHEAGLEAYLDPWGLGGLFAGEAFSAFLTEHPVAWQVRADGTPVAAACPNAPVFRTLLRDWVDGAAKAKADVLFWDDPTLSPPEAGSGPGGWTCRCRHCQERFGGPMPTGLTPEVAAFRREMVLDLLRDVCGLGRSLGMRNVVGVFPPDAPKHLPASWDEIASIQGVDSLAVSAFWHLWGLDLETHVGGASRSLVEVCARHGIEPMGWVQAFLIGEGREGELERAARVMASAGIESIAAWGFRGCEQMSAIACDRPDEVWRVLGSAFRGLREGG